MAQDWNYNKLYIAYNLRKSNKQNPTTSVIKSLSYSTTTILAKMVKHTQTIRRQLTDELFECVWTFCEIGA